MNQIRNSTIPAASGFSLTEMMVTVATIGILSSLLVPPSIKYIWSTEMSNANSFVSATQATIGAYIDATGEEPTTWNDLTSIASIMTNKGQASGVITTPIITPDSKYEISVSKQGESTFEINAERIDDIEKYNIRSCFDISNGASSIRTGNGNKTAEVPNCN